MTPEPADADTINPRGFKARRSRPATRDSAAAQAESASDSHSRVGRASDRSPWTLTVAEIPPRETSLAVNPTTNDRKWTLLVGKLPTTGSSVRLPPSAIPATRDRQPPRRKRVTQAVSAGVAAVSGSEGTSDGTTTDVAPSGAAAAPQPSRRSVSQTSRTAQFAPSQKRGNASSHPHQARSSGASTTNPRADRGMIWLNRARYLDERAADHLTRARRGRLFGRGGGPTPRPDGARNSQRWEFGSFDPPALLHFVQKWTKCAPIGRGVAHPCPPKNSPADLHNRLWLTGGRVARESVMLLPVTDEARELAVSSVA
jgi:hypothetical protein